MKKLLFLSPLVLLAVLGGFLAKGLLLDPSLLPSPLVNHPIPQFSLPELQAAEREVGTADFEGEVVVFNIWASWCVSCRQEHRYLVRMARDYGIPIYGLNYKDERADGLEYLRRFGNPYIWNAFDHEGRVGIEWGVYGTPETFVIDRQGVIRYKHVGPITWAKVERDILPLIQRLRSET
ncbi:cytochrome c biogenesis protein CcmG, thiol:disulfide interchange protein DsbE [Ectothiorhodosinus mongolicus]|uniref:Cytochrome c biogenesis protein CcmG, thiol:disulfide interchange protein DsbE n=1 Tax=Ectothiorhodosinus mongolicus TaxID=233100 RepID=A0A1R3VZ20_9GAMM|nr:DsbE family thiol:disulfide interchange protein [Ectothiorhodosinus mongolicus]ULX57185.1 DsbE family thiol:disulfide interchange protein [Ectothiorhodosinus mongolicus]SIT70312.1 cytochrome c biogenesis protein CcmG, thiol:disulfide interchange protein DsbE [Ectothiorhodosinus mongolicus]